MKIIGRVLKKTTAIGFKRNHQKGLSFDYQIETLSGLLEKAKKTNFGKNHRFSQLIESSNFIQEYQKEVPLVEYDEFYQTWLHRSIDGVEDNTWPGKIKYYALSSGTTGSPSKRIPVTKETINSFQKTSMRQIITLHQLDLPAEFFQKSILVVGGSTKLNKIENHIEGDLSGILKKHTSRIVSPFTKPSNEVANIKDWNTKLDKMVELAPTWDIGVVAGVPSWCIMLMERIIAHYNLKSIHDIWPNFHVYVHGGVFIQPYLKRLEKVSGQKVHMLDTYLASEGYFAYQNKLNSSSMKLLLDSGVFHEFIPFNENYFDQEGKLKDIYKALTLEEVEKGIDYALVITTNAGLWRYIIGDLVQFTDVEERQIKITGRIKQYLSLVGEHLSLDNINEALSTVSNEMDVDIQEFGITCDIENMRHEWFFGIDSPIDEQTFLDKLDKELIRLNDDYEYTRKLSLKNPTIRTVKTDMFYKFMEKMGKLGSQNKFPRVMNQFQGSEWKRFLDEN